MKVGAVACIGQGVGSIGPSSLLLCHCWLSIDDPGNMNADMRNALKNPWLIVNLPEIMCGTANAADTLLVKSWTI